LAPINSCDVNLVQVTPRAWRTILYWTAASHACYR